MQTSPARHVAAFAAALALALVPTTASAVLERVGPNRTDNFLPSWYQDTTGLTMDFCTPQTQAELDGGWCLLLPVDVPGGLAPEVFPNAFSGEHFYWASDVVGDWTYAIPGPPGQTPITITSKVLLVQAIEAAFLGNIGPGLGQVFGRVRLRVLDLPLTGIYKFYTPWGIKEIAGLAGDRIFDTEDIGINCPPFQYDCALETSIGPFLVPSNSPGGAELAAVPGPSGGLFLSDPNRIGPVTGSPVVGNYMIAAEGEYTQTAAVPTNPNVFAIEAPDGQVIFKSHDFSTVGRIWTNVIPGRVKSDRASYSREADGAIRLDAFATGEPTVAPRLPTAAPSNPTQPELHLFSAPCTGTVDPTGNLLPPYGEPAGVTSVPMSRNGNLYFSSTAPAAVPAGVCVKDANARTAQGVVQPTYTLGNVTDQVFVTAAVYDPSNGGSLSVRGSSSDQFAPPLLSLGAFGTLLANVPLTDDLAYLTPLAAPPEHVRVHSQEGGTAELLVKVGSRRATGVSLTADLSSPQPIGTAVVFKAQGEGAIEYLYRFWVDSGSGFGATPAQDWSTSPYMVLPTTTPVGSYRVLAEVWAGLQPSAPDAASNIVAFTIKNLPASGVALVANRTSPRLAGTPVTFTATGSGSAGYQYRFYLSTNAGAAQLVQDYGAGSAWTMPASTPVGTHTVRVDVRTSDQVDLDSSTTLAFQLVAPPAMVSPTPGSLLPAYSATFDWTGSASMYALTVGTSARAQNIYYSGNITSSTATAIGLPAAGGPVYVTLWSLIDSTWHATDYTYTAGIAANSAALTSPTAGSALPPYSATFTWTGTASLYALTAGTSVRAQDIFYSGNTSGTTATVNGLPAAGGTVYVTLWYLVGPVWYALDYIYSATPVPAITSPTPGGPLPALSATFNWTGSASMYALTVGTSARAQDLYYSGNIPATTVTATGLPASGGTVHVTLWYRIGTTWRALDYTYTVSPATAELTTPVPGSQLSWPSTTFHWTGNANEYALTVGTSPRSQDIYHSGNSASLTATATGLPPAGGSVYVTLWYRIGTTWRALDYTYSVAPAASLTNPPEGTLLSSTSTSFAWTGSAAEYSITIGTSAGASDLWYSGNTVATGTTAIGLPVRAATTFVSLWYRVGATWYHLDKTYAGIE